jgi:hypothetical protein
MLGRRLGALAAAAVVGVGCAFGVVPSMDCASRRWSVWSRALVVEVTAVVVVGVGSIGTAMRGSVACIDACGADGSPCAGRGAIVPAVARAAYTEWLRAGRDEARSVADGGTAGFALGLSDTCGRPHGGGSVGIRIASHRLRGDAGLDATVAEAWKGAHGPGQCKNTASELSIANRSQPASLLGRSSLAIGERIPAGGGEAHRGARK